MRYGRNACVTAAVRMLLKVASASARTCGKHAAAHLWSFITPYNGNIRRRKCALKINCAIIPLKQ